MRRFISLAVLVIVAVLAGGTLAAHPGKPTIMILATGGTIAVIQTFHYQYVIPK